MAIKNFIASEDGAVAVDWVVLTGGLVGLGIATASVTSGGVENLSGDIAQALANIEISAGFAFVAATAALTQTSLWDTPGQQSTEFANIDRLSFATEVTFGAGDEGIIFEAGGTGRGFVMYQHDGVLYLQAGDGSGFGETASRGEASWQVSEGTHTIEGSMNADGGLALYVNGSMVDQSSFQAASLAGGNSGTVAGGTSSVSRNRGGFDRSDPGHPGVNEVAFYANQTTGDELAPTN